MDYRANYSNSKPYGLSSTSGYADRYNNNRGGSIKQSSSHVCHYCDKSFNYLYDLNNHYVYCNKRPGKYGAEARGMT